MLINIQFLRFIAATLVVLYHTADHLLVSGHATGPLFGLGKAAGFAGVDIFFVISGFIMVWTTPQESGAGAALSFARRRIARIYSGYWPFYFIALALFSWLGLSYVQNARLVSSFFLWPTPLAELLLAVSWTLIFEMWFYLLFTILLLGRAEQRQRYLWVLTAVVLVWSLYSQFFRHAYDRGELEAMSVYEQYLAFPFLLEFLAGALLADRLRRKPGGPAVTMLAAGIALFLAAGWVNTVMFDQKLLQGYFILWRVALFGSASLLILAGLVRLEQKGIRLPARFSLATGGASYALYLSHTLILEWSYRLGLPVFVSEQGTLLARFTYLLLALAIICYSVAHYRWLERPLHRVFKRLLRV